MPGPELELLASEPLLVPLAEVVRGAAGAEVDGESLADRRDFVRAVVRFEGADFRLSDDDGE